MEADVSSGSERDQLLARLNVFIGEWSKQAVYDNAPAGTSVFEWALDRQFLVERSTIPHPDFPDSLLIISVSADGKTYTQHYFDSSGNARVYAMDLVDSRWTLVRDEPDFTPLEFSQRFAGSIADDGKAITGAWEEKDADGVWRKHFDLVYRKLR